MRIDGPVDLLELVTAYHDGIYPSKSPTPELKAVGCAKPTISCITLEYVWTHGKRMFCRAPSTFCPPDFLESDCPRKLHDLEAMSTAQSQKYKPVKIPYVAIGRDDTRQRRRVHRLQVWSMNRLRSYANDGDDVARAIVDDLDVPYSLCEYLIPMTRLWEEYQQLPKELK